MSKQAIRVGSLATLCTVLLTVLLWFLSVACSSAQPAALSGAAAQLLLGDDTRLERKISFKETCISLDELLQCAGNKDLTLKADASCADMKIQLCLKQRSLRVLMQSLGEMLPGEWRPLNANAGYKLSLTPATLRRRKQWWDVFLSEREQALNFLREQVLQEMRAKPFRRQPDDPNLEHSNLAIEVARAEEQEFFNLLPAQIQESIANNLIEFSFYCRNGVTATGDFEERATSVLLRDLPPRAQDLLRHTQSAVLFESHRKVDWSTAAVRFTNKGHGVTATLLLPNKEATHVYALATPMSPHMIVLFLNHTRLAEQVRRMGRTAPRTWRELADYQNSRVWPNDPPRQKPSNDPIRRVDVLHWLADKADIEFVADYYSQPGIPTYSLYSDLVNFMTQPLPRPLKEELDQRAAEQDMSWKQAGNNLYLFRDNRWYRNDNLEVPASLLKRWLTWKEAAQLNGKVPDLKTAWTREQVKAQLDWEAEVTSKLSLWQMFNGLAYFTPYTPDKHPVHQVSVENEQRVAQYAPSFFPFETEVMRLVHEYYTVRLYAECGEDARTALITGGLPFAALTADQKREALSLLPASDVSKIAENKATARLGLYSNVGYEEISLFDLPRIRLYVVSEPARN